MESEWVTVETVAIKEILQSKNIRPSYTRIKIFNYLISNFTHPTVDEIYQAVAKEIPTLSKTTVYNSLNLFMEAKLAKLIDLDDNESRYDGDVSDHGHFKCTICCSIADFSVNIDELYVNGLDGFTIDEKNVYFKGVCSRCNHQSI